MFYGPTVGGLITQHLSFEWAAAVQGGLAFLAVSKSLCSMGIHMRKGQEKTDHYFLFYYFPIYNLLPRRQEQMIALMLATVAWSRGAETA